MWVRTDNTVTNHLARLAPRPQTAGLTFAGHESTAMLLGVFHVSILHNIVHLLFGVVGLVMARSAVGARRRS